MSISTGGWRSGESHNLEEWDLLEVSRDCWLIAIRSEYLLPTPDPSFPARPLLSRHNWQNHLQSVGIIFRGLVDFCRRCVNCPISSRHLSFSVLSCPISSKFLSFSFLSCATTSVLCCTVSGISLNKKDETFLLSIFVLELVIVVAEGIQFTPCVR